MPFSIVGATQVPFAVRLIVRMDQGHGLLDRFLFLFPPCYQPSVEDTDTSIMWLESQNVDSLTNIFVEMEENMLKTNYKFDDEHKNFCTNLANEIVKSNSSFHQK